MKNGIINENNYQAWYMNDQLHNEEGPAIIFNNGTKRWYQHNIRHREDGPAIEEVSGYKAWYIKGILHREDGPAIEHSNGKKEWYLEGIAYPEEMYHENAIQVAQKIIQDMNTKQLETISSIVNNMLKIRKKNENVYLNNEKKIIHK